MGQYLLSTYAVEGDVPRAPATPEDMKTFMERVVALEEEMEATGTFVFGGALHGPDAATVLRASDGGLYHSLDGGLNWVLVNANSNCRDIHIDPSDSKNLFCNTASRSRYSAPTKLSSLAIPGFV